MDRPVWLTTPPPGKGRWFAARLRGAELVAVGQHPNGWRARTRHKLPAHPFLVVPAPWEFAPVELRPGKAHEACEAAYRLIRAVRAGAWEEAGAAVDAAWAAERDERLRLGLRPGRADVVYAEARSAGAWGGRPGPGYLVLVCAPERQEAVCKSLSL